MDTVSRRFRKGAYRLLKVEVEFRELGENSSWEYALIIQRSVLCEGENWKRRAVKNARNGLIKRRINSEKGLTPFRRMNCERFWYRRMGIVRNSLQLW